MSSLFNLESGDQVGFVSIAISVVPADDMPADALLERVVSSSEEQQETGALLIEQGWIQPGEARVFQTIHSMPSAIDSSRFLRITRTFATPDSVIAIVATTFEPVDDSRYAVLLQVLDSFKRVPSLYESLQLEPLP